MWQCGAEGCGSVEQRGVAVWSRGVWQCGTEGSGSYLSLTSILSHSHLCRSIVNFVSGFDKRH